MSIVYRRESEKKFVGLLTPMSYLSTIGKKQMEKYENRSCNLLTVFKHLKNLIQKDETFSFLFFYRFGEMIKRWIKIENKWLNKWMNR